MTVKVSKKDRLAALMTMWEVLKAEITGPRPPSKESGSYQLLNAVEAQLKDVLELNTRTVTVKVLDMPEVKAKLEEIQNKLNEAEAKAKEATSSYYSLRSAALNGLQRVVELKNAGKLDEALVAAENLKTELSQYN